MWESILATLPSRTHHNSIDYTPIMEVWRILSLYWTSLPDQESRPLFRRYAYQVAPTTFISIPLGLEIRKVWHPSTWMKAE
jgi:hypothetical protein